MISAIGIAVFGAFRLQDGVIRPLPDAAAHQTVTGEDGIPVFLQAAGADAHGVRVFAQEEGLFPQLLFLTPFADFAHMIDVRIHFRDHVIGNAPGADHTLIVHRNFRAHPMQVFAAGILVFPAPGLIAERPQDDTGMVAVAQVHAFYAVKVMIDPLFIVADPVRPVNGVAAGAMSFDIRLVDHIETVKIAQRQKYRVRRIVGGAHRIDIQAFHQLYVAQQILRVHDIALQRGVVMVDPLEFDRLSIEGEDVLFDDDATEACKIAQAFHGHPVLF